MVSGLYSSLLKSYKSRIESGSVGKNRKDLRLFLLSLELVVSGGEEDKRSPRGSRRRGVVGASVIGREGRVIWLVVL